MSTVMISVRLWCVHRETAKVGIQVGGSVILVRKPPHFLYYITLNELIASHESVDRKRSAVDVRIAPVFPIDPRP